VGRPIDAVRDTPITGDARAAAALFYEEVPAVTVGDFFLLNTTQRRVRGFEGEPSLFLSVWLARR
jgi:hypothetical protein